MNHHVQTAVHFATVEGRVLAAALKPLCFVVERRSTYPILAMVRLRLDGTTLSVTGTDLDLELSIDLDVSDCSGEWELCVDARTLAGIARVAGPALVRMEKAELVDGKSTQTILRVSLDEDETVYTLTNVLSVDAWPTLKGERGDKIERFGNGSLPAQLAKVSSCISREETRYYLNGVCWTIGDAGRWMCSTDGHRLLKLDYAMDPGPAAQRIIPQKTVELLTRFFAGADITVHKIGDAAGGLDFVVGTNTVIRSKLIEGTYPDVMRVIPKADSIKHDLPVGRMALEAAIRRVSLLPKPFQRTGVRLFAVDGHLAVDVDTHSDGKVEVKLRDEWPEGLSDFGVNRRYLADMLRTCDGNPTLRITEAGSPILITDGDEQMTRILMPMRV